MKTIAFDYGTERIGVAASDEMGMLAKPLPFISAKPPREARRLLRGLLETERPACILVGLPRHMDGNEGDSAARAREFAEMIREIANEGTTIDLIDERLSTMQASRMLQEAGYNTRKQRTRIDSASAVVLLQGWLDAQMPEADLQPDEEDWDE